MYYEIEGIEASYKSTTCTKVARLLDEEGYKTSIHSQPGGSVIGEMMKGIIKNPPYHIPQHLMFHVLMAARTDVMVNKISPALRDGFVCIGDRGNLSTIALQGFAGGIDINLIERTISENPHVVIPEITFLLKISHETSVRRQKERGTTDFVEELGEEYHRAVFDGMVSYASDRANDSPIAGKIITIECSDDMTSTDIAHIIFEKIKSNLKKDL